jgi:hypothetical protein
MKPWMAALFAWLLATAVLVPLSIFLVLVLAGPHGGLLPSHLGPAVLVTGWALALGGPLLAARSVYRRLDRSR